MTKKQIWNFCKIGAVVLIMVTFSPLVTPVAKHKPILMGMPYTLWTGIVVSVLLIGFTWLGTRIHPGKDE